jgi:hypothetical protein
VLQNEAVLLPALPNARLLVVRLRLLNALLVPLALRRKPRPVLRPLLVVLRRRALLVLPVLLVLRLVVPLRLLALLVPLPRPLRLLPALKKREPSFPFILKENPVSLSF